MQGSEDTPFRMERKDQIYRPEGVLACWAEFDADHARSGLYGQHLARVGRLQGRSPAVYDALEQCSLELLDTLDKYLGNPEGTLRGMAQDGNTILRALHYPAMDDHTFIPGAIRAAAHEDINLITLLITSTASGLQLQRRDGSWMDVNAEPGEIIVDSGDMLARITNGVLPATTHRVVNPPDGGTRRFSLPFFVHPRPDVVLRVFDKCRGPGFPTPKDDITADEFLKKRLAAIGLGKI